MRSLSIGAISALMLAIVIATSADARCGRIQSVRPHLKRQFVINQPYGEVMGSILQSQLEDVEDAISINKEGNIQLEKVPIGQRGIEIRKITIKDQEWESVKVKCNVKTMNLEGRAIGSSRIVVEDETTGRLSFRVKHDMEVGTDSTKLCITLLDRVHYQQTTISGCEGEVIFKKHGTQTLVETRLMFNAHVCVPRIFPRLVSRIAWNTANSINCQLQCEAEKSLREAAARHKDDPTVIPVILRMLRKENLIPDQKILNGLKIGEVSAKLWKDEKGVWQTEADAK